jgi:hypothetical protein
VDFFGVGRKMSTFLWTFWKGFRNVHNFVDIFEVCLKLSTFSGQHFCGRFGGRLKMVTNNSESGMAYRFHSEYFVPDGTLGKGQNMILPIAGTQGRQCNSFERWICLDTQGK